MKKIKLFFIRKLISHYLKNFDEKIDYKTQYWVVFRADHVKNNRLAYKVFNRNLLEVNCFLRKNEYSNRHSFVYSVDILPGKFFLAKLKTTGIEIQSTS